MTLVAEAIIPEVSTTMADRLTRSLKVVNEELSIVGISLGEGAFFYDRDEAQKGRCYLTCAGDAAPHGRSALVTFTDDECHAFVAEAHSLGVCEVASTSSGQDSDVCDFLLAVVEALASPASAPRQ